MYKILEDKKLYMQYNIFIGAPFGATWRDAPFRGLLREGINYFI
jgi:hypothetical protein